MTPYFIVCPHLIVYKDFAYSQESNKMYTDSQIATCECKRQLQGLPCTNRGRCIIAKEEDTWKNVSSKSW